jgi:phosphopantothenoylcysteine decarboxylase/phosphopantothenate--cysteine ligase
MFEAATTAFLEMDIAVLCAAVADYRPLHVSGEKIKRKDGESISIQLTPNKDIAAEIGKMKKANQRVIGFALETDHEELNAKQKMEKKNLDFIVLNSLRDPGAGFKNDTNKVTIISRNGEKTEFPLKTKKEVAIDIINMVTE